MDNVIELPTDSEHYRRQARMYLRRCDHLERQNTLMYEVLKNIRDQGGDVVEKWAADLAQKVLHTIDEHDREEASR